MLPGVIAEDILPSINAVSGRADGIGQATGLLPRFGLANGVGGALGNFAVGAIAGHADGKGAASGINQIDAATAAWLTAVSAAGGTVSDPRIALVDNLVRGLKSDGIWTKLDRLYLLAAENAPSALTDLVSHTTATLVAPNPSFTIDRGYTGTGTNGQILTGFNQSTASSPHAIQNDTHFSLWSNSNPLPTSITGEYGGADPSGGGTYWLYFTGDSSFYFRTNDNGGATGTAASFTNHQGHFISSRNGSTTRRVYYNGSLHNTTSATSQAVPNIQHSILTSGLTHQVSAYSVGSNLDAGSDASNFYTRLRTYMSAVGVP
jgi:hypothetical protein